MIRPNPDLNNETVNRTVWGEIMEAADRNNQPGKFTAFMDWEWSSTPQGANLHRVIVMRGGKTNGENFLPYTAFDSSEPEDLWAWLEETSAKANTDFLAIPHNSNISKGTWLGYGCCRHGGRLGDPELAAVWTDPDFDAGKRAFYYVRVLQIPTPRSTLFDAIALSIDVKETGNPATIQERAYSSPIWYTP